MYIHDSPRLGALGAERAPSVRRSVIPGLLIGGLALGGVALFLAFTQRGGGVRRIMKRAR